jgi:6-pyruvoyltetrahydropterin/6-carboxytetrahydropterin synthase
VKYDKYKFKFYLNASHSIYINGVLGQNHPHTWELSLDVLKVWDSFVQFNNVEKAIEDLLSKFQNNYINEIEPFTELNPTLENICEYFKEELKNLLMNIGWILMIIEISETPSRSYIIDLIDEVDESELQDSRSSTLKTGENNKSIGDIAQNIVDNIKK